VGDDETQVLRIGGHLESAGRGDGLLGCELHVEWDIRTSGNRVVSAAAIVGQVDGYAEFALRYAAGSAGQPQGGHANDMPGGRPPGGAFDGDAPVVEASRVADLQNSARPAGGRENDGAEICRGADAQSAQQHERANAAAANREECGADQRGRGGQEGRDEEEIEYAHNDYSSRKYFIL